MATDSKEGKTTSRTAPKPEPPSTFFPRSNWKEYREKYNAWWQEERERRIREKQNTKAERHRNSGKKSSVDRLAYDTWRKGLKERRGQSAKSSPSGPPSVEVSRKEFLLTSGALLLAGFACYRWMVVPIYREISDWQEDRRGNREQRRRDTSRGTAANQRDAHRDMLRTRAFEVSREFVKRRLSSPSTAKFPSSWNALQYVTVVDNADQVYRVSAWVDAENAFGATVRHNYTAVLHYNSDDLEWSLRSLDFH